MVSTLAYAYIVDSPLLDLALSEVGGGTESVRALVLSVVAYKIAAALYSPGTLHWKATMTSWLDMTCTLVSFAVPDDIYDEYPNPALALAHCFYEVTKLLEPEHSPDNLLRPMRLRVVERIWASGTCRVRRSTLSDLAAGDAGLSVAGNWWIPAIRACDACISTWFPNATDGRSATLCHTTLSEACGRCQSISSACQYKKVRR